MNRVVKAAVAATAFGLAAALAVPAQAEAQYETARNAPADGPGGGTSVAGGSPVGGLLGGLTSGGVGGGLLGGLLGGKSKSAAAGGGQVRREPSEAEKDAIAASGRRAPVSRPQTPNSAEDAVRRGRPIPELSPIRSGIPLGGGGMTEALPVVSGARRVATPAGGAARRTVRHTAALNAAGAGYGPFHLVTGLVEDARGAAGKVRGSGMLDSAALPGLPGPSGATGGGGGGLPISGLHGVSDQTVSELTGGASPLDALAGPVTGLASLPLSALSGGPLGGPLSGPLSAPLGALSGPPAAGLLAAPARDFDSLPGGASPAGLAQAALRALPSKSGAVPVVGRVAPVGTAAVAEALPATVRHATVEELAPLAADAAAVVETNGTKAVAGYSDLMAALGWTTDALTSSVRDTWNRG
ncbi:hypothetical protein [Nonomuraea wenchangensis]|uniref:Elastin n=1 Tax=Nonomuraea wenchangensis TaxID=568860 RepID=A0A1I0LYE8_9ACTN|nr:hypothetical protein [Nonomuraea wenchangensis]SEU48093.1 hypothetical protein SAMN05421811_13421 [Nonomuraea wenchangensis]